MTVQVAVLPAGSDVWGTPAGISLDGQIVSSPRIAIDAKGDALAVWSSRDVVSSGTVQIVQAAWRPAATGVWQSPVDLSLPGGVANEPNVGFDGQGNAVVAWLAFPRVIRAAVRPAATGLWQPSVDVSAVDQGFIVDPELAVSPRGDAALVWWGDGGIQASVRPASTGVWGSPVRLSPIGERPVTPQVALDAQGNAIAVWSSDVGGNYPVIEASLRPALTGQWQTPVALSFSSVATGDHNSTEPQIAFDPHGNAVAVWTHEEIGLTVIQAAVRPATNGVWQPAFDISRPDRSLPRPQSGSQPQVAIDANGNTLAIWRTLIDGIVPTSAIQTALLPAGSAEWQAPIYHSRRDAQAEQPQVAFDALGNAVGVWLRTDPPGSVPASHRVVQSAVYALTARGHGTPAAPGPPADATPRRAVAALRVISARLTRTRFRAAGGRVVRGGARVGTSIQIALTVPAQLRIVIRQRVPGIRRGNACVSPRRLGTRRAAPCIRSVTRGVRTVPRLRQGVNKVVFDGRVAGRRLAPGRYTATLTAFAATGESMPKTLSFTIVA